MQRSRHSSFERLSALDAAFLDIEDDRNLMHTGACAIFEGGQLLDQAGRVDPERYRRYANAILDDLPHWRMRLSRVPLLRHPVLVPDALFELSHHLRFETAPQGTERDVEAIAGRLYSRRLDRNRPLWEQSIVDGLAGRRFAVITKLHHAMADGVAGIGTLAAMLGASPDATIVCSQAPMRQPPSRLELLRSELEHRIAEPRALAQLLRESAGNTQSLRSSAHDMASGLASAARMLLHAAPETLLNPPQVGPRRCFRGVRLSLADVQAVKRASDGKLNDVVLAVVAGALRRFFEYRGAYDERDLQCMVPVSIHDPGSSDIAGNKVSLMLVPLPVSARDPRERMGAVIAATRLAKAKKQSYAFQRSQQLAEWTWGGVMSWSTRIVMRLRPYNLVVTNIPGPQFPLYLLDSRMLNVYPMVPLYGNQALGIALVSYDGSLFFGLNADADLLPDLDVLGDAVVEAFRELREAYLGRPHEVRAAAVERRARERIPERHAHAEPWTCPRCGTVQDQHSFRHLALPTDAAQVRCRVCHRPEDDVAAAPVHAQSPFE